MNNFGEGNDKIGEGIPITGEGLRRPCENWGRIENLLILGKD
jgi:hypothetical protein